MTPQIQSEHVIEEDFAVEEATLKKTSVDAEVKQTSVKGIQNQTRPIRIRLQMLNWKRKKGGV